MYILVKYISTGLKLVLLSLLITMFAQYISIFYLITLFVSLTFFIHYLIQLDIYKEKESQELIELESFSNGIIDKYSINDVDFKITSDYSGMILYNMLKPNTLHIPSDANPRFQTEESKAVIAHELGHVVYNDLSKIEFIKMSLICIMSLIFYVLYSSVQFYLFALVVTIFICIVPYILNYFNHKFEYRADLFAVEHTSVHAVSIRLRRNKRLFENPWYRNYLPYIMPHPSTENRLNNILTR